MGKKRSDGLRWKPRFKGKKEGGAPRKWTRPEGGVGGGDLLQNGSWRWDKGGKT